MRYLKMSGVVPEGAVGSIIADLGHRIRNMEFEVVELVDGRSKRTPAKLDTLTALSKPRSVEELSALLQITKGAAAQRITKLRAAKKIKKTDDGRWRRA